jgi:hypothetical protein
MATAKKTRAKQSSTLKRAKKTLNQAAHRVQRRTRSLERDASSMMTRAGGWASDAATYTKRQVKQSPVLAAAISAAALAAVGWVVSRQSH